MSWLLAFAGFATLVILHEFGHFTAAKAVGMRVEKFSLFFPPTIASKKVGETEYAIGAIPAGGYVKISGMNPDEKLPDEVRTRAYYSQPVWKRLVVIAAGPFMNLLLAFLLLFIFFWAIGPHTGSQRVGDIQKGYPAVAHLRPGDRLISVDGHRGGPEQFAKLISAHHCARRPPAKGCHAAKPVRLVVQRAKRRVQLELTPIYDPQEKRTRLGFAYQLGPRDPFPFGPAVRETGKQFGYIAGQTVTLPVRLFNPQKRKEISGVVGSYEVTRQTIVQSAADVVGILAIISLSLAIVNLFPFLPLDGGHIFWAVVEKVRRRPVPFSVMERSSVIGFILVIFIFFIGLSNDIGRLSGQGFNVR